MRVHQPPCGYLWDDTFLVVRGCGRGQLHPVVKNIEYKNNNNINNCFFFFLSFGDYQNLRVHNIIIILFCVRFHLLGEWQYVCSGVLAWACESLYSTHNIIRYAWCFYIDFIIVARRWPFCGANSAPSSLLLVLELRFRSSGYLPLQVYIFHNSFKVWPSISLSIEYFIWLI